MEGSREGGGKRCSLELRLRRVIAQAREQRLVQ